jgi:type IV pilus assembly protein PilM
LPSTLAAVSVLHGDEPSLVVNRNGNSLTTAIIRQNELLLHRTLELAEPEWAALRPDEKEWLPTGEQRDAIEELQQSVSVAIAYFEDTLSTPPRQLLCSGYGGAEDLARLLGDSTIPARDLAPTPATGHTTAMPRGVLAGVLGALAS